VYGNISAGAAPVIRARSGNVASICKPARLPLILLAVMTGVGMPRLNGSAQFLHETVISEGSILQAVSVSSDMEAAFFYERMMSQP
jgi:hypothetical protein